MADEPSRNPDGAFFVPDAAPPGQPRRRRASVEGDEPDLRAELEELRRRVQQNDDEIDAMQISAARSGPTSPLQVIRQPAVLISFLSLLLAFGTTVLSSTRLDQDRQHQSRVELTGYIQRLTDIPRMQAEVAQQHPGASADALLAELNAQLQSLAYQARNIIRTIPDQVSTVEYMAVGYALQSVGAFDEADQLYTAGLVYASSTSDRVYALRARAGLRFLEREYAAGRDLYQQARDAYSSVSDAAQLVAANDNAQTELLWANAELGAGFCAEASRHAGAMAQIMASEPLTHLSASLAQLQTAVVVCVPRAAPAPSPT